MYSEIYFKKFLDFLQHVNVLRALENHFESP